MSVWFAIPTANNARASKCLKAWKDRGYKTAALIDGENLAPPENCDQWIWNRSYPGWGGSVNQLAKMLVASHGAQWVVTGGDDHYPDTKKSPQAIAEECEWHFKGTLGVMQPTGDQWGRINECCDCPWLGREWIERAYQGKGPMNDRYRHFFVSEELQLVSQRLLCFWQRPDITQYHDHFIRKGESPLDYQVAVRGKSWLADRDLFEARKAAFFPNSDLL